MVAIKGHRIRINRIHYNGNEADMFTQRETATARIYHEITTKSLATVVRIDCQATDEHRGLRWIGPESRAEIFGKGFAFDARCADRVIANDSPGSIVVDDVDDRRILWIVSARGTQVNIERWIR